VPVTGKLELAFSVSIKDCEVQHFRAGGPGGQKQNKTSSGSRVIHHPSGARGESREERSQLQNTKIAFRRMAESKKFAIWKNRQLYFHGEKPEERVKRDMLPQNLRIEGRFSGQWALLD
jgi:protein subunit release factor B